ASKQRLFAMQSSQHPALVAGDDAEAAAIADRLGEERGAKNLFRFDHATIQQRQAGWQILQGPHNAQNAAAAIAACEALGLSEADIEQGLRSYPGLPHRMERLGEYGGVLFINDSKATNPASTAPALAAYP